uniref:Uncharacterized protein n=2 Tax=Emiliania huxleyi TaxID=2903 RepID=A0A7S3W0V3_EMIHU
MPDEMTAGELSAKLREILALPSTPKLWLRAQRDSGELSLEAGKPVGPYYALHHSDDDELMHVAFTLGDAALAHPTAGAALGAATASAAASDDAVRTAGAEGDEGGRGGRGGGGRRGRGRRARSGAHRRR